MNEPIEKIVAHNLMVAIKGTLCDQSDQNGLDPLICLTELHRLVLAQIDIELEEWSSGLDNE
jgi:hypothetical protein